MKKFNPPHSTEEKTAAADLVAAWREKVTAALLAAGIRHRWVRPYNGEAWIIMRKEVDLEQGIRIVEAATSKFLESTRFRKRRNRKKEG